MPNQTKADALATTQHYFTNAVGFIDEAFGEGYAARHPELIAAFLQTSAIEAAIGAGRQSSQEVCETLLKLKPRFFG